jgi:5-methylcytosine-specific restriction protein A
MHSRTSDLDRGGNRWLWSKKRALVMARDNRRCQLGIAGVCTSIATEVDHIRPRAVGGTDEMNNLRAVCRRCHISRGMDESGRAPSRYSYGSSRVVTRDYSAR